MEKYAFNLSNIHSVLMANHTPGLLVREIHSPSFVFHVFMETGSPFGYKPLLIIIILLVLYFSNLVTVYLVI